MKKILLFILLLALYINSNAVIFNKIIVDSVQQKEIQQSKAKQKNESSKEKLEGVSIASLTTTILTIISQITLPETPHLLNTKAYKVGFGFFISTALAVISSLRVKSKKVKNKGKTVLYFTIGLLISMLIYFGYQESK